MKKLLTLGVIIILTACRSISPPAVLTEDKAGRALTMTAIPESGSRKDVPVGVHAHNVVTQAKFEHGGGIAQISITRTGFLGLGEPMLYTNCLECHAKPPIPFVQPKDPWWKFPVMFLILVGFALTFLFLGKLKEIFLNWRK